MPGAGRRSAVLWWGKVALLGVFWRKKDRNRGTRARGRARAQQTRHCIQEERALFLLPENVYSPVLRHFWSLAEHRAAPRRQFCHKT
jgi:hypothetical protein